jgi:hypothetical protein
MSSTFSFVYDGVSAAEAFHGIGINGLLLSLLAGITPEPGWEGVTVFQGDSPLDDPAVCIGMTGAGADELQLKLIDGLERQGVRILQVYDGGPEPKMQIATARDGKWVQP